MARATQRKVYGPGVLDVSRFEYDLRTCDDSSGYGDQGYHALSLLDPPKNTSPDAFVVDGIVIIDHNHAMPIVGQQFGEQRPILGWNGLNGGWRIGQNTRRIQPVRPRRRRFADDVGRFHHRHQCDCLAELQWRRREPGVGRRIRREITG